MANAADEPNPPLSLRSLPALVRARLHDDGQKDFVMLISDPQEKEAFLKFMLPRTGVKQENLVGLDEPGSYNQSVYWLVTLTGKDTGETLKPTRIFEAYISSGGNVETNASSESVTDESAMVRDAKNYKFHLGKTINLNTENALPEQGRTNVMIDIDPDSTPTAIGPDGARQLIEHMNEYQYSGAPIRLPFEIAGDTMLGEIKPNAPIGAANHESMLSPKYV